MQENEITSLAVLVRGPDRYLPASPWGALAALVVTGLAVLAPLGVLAFIGFAATAQGLDEAELDRLAESFSSLKDPLGIAAMLGTQLVSAGVIWLAAGRAGMRAEVLRLLPPRPSWGAAILLGLLLVVITAPVELALYRLAGIDLFADTRWLVEGLRSPYWWGVAFVGIIAAPVWEELAFRGFLLSALAKTRIGFWPAALVSTALWTGLHAGYSWAGLVSVFIAGVALSWIVRRTGSLRAAVVAHAVANLFALTFAATFAPA